MTGSAPVEENEVSVGLLFCVCLFTLSFLVKGNEREGREI